ncbi:MAG: hypothetical protein EA359_07015 [Balneolaceae bacterium]|nr:MAG: hypothetical protein EA359_07015 [Balneolaceae bacterium]
MGQQQILLVILITIVIGITTIVALNVLNQRTQQSNRDAVRQDLAAAASYVQALWERPNLMGGANRRFTNLQEEIILQYLNIPATDYTPGDNEAKNDNGTYSVVIVDDAELIIIGVPDSGPPNISIRIFRDDNTGRWLMSYLDNDEDD